MENILLISKEILRKDYLSYYGSKLYHTPNIDKLAKRGTIFTNCYTPAPSTGMAVTCMFSGLNAYELDRSDYTEVKPFTQCPTLFSILNDKGYEIHVVWPNFFVDYAEKYSKVFTANTKLHNLEVDYPIPRRQRIQQKFDIRKAVAHPTDIEKYYQETAKIIKDISNPTFIWVHLPHILNPRKCFGSDIDLFDNLVGELMNLFDGSIYLTADHGHMNYEKNIIGYAFHVYEGEVGVPLITPRLMGMEVIKEPISLIQLKNIILEKRVYPQEYIYSDTQYYQQPNRKLAIRKGDFKYIYNKKGKSEELYDLSNDPNENVNLLIKELYDPDRKWKFCLDEVYYYERWDEAEKAYIELRAEKDRIWKKGPIFTSLLITIKNIIRPVIRGSLLESFIGMLPRRKVIGGRWDSKARMNIP